MGCCEHKPMQYEFVEAHETNSDKRKSSFNDISIYTENDDIGRCTLTTPHIDAYLNTSFGNIEGAFLIGPYVAPKS